MERLSVIKFHNSVKDTLREFHEYRYVFFNMVRRNLEGRYRNTFLGVAWHFFIPVLTIMLYYIVFTEIKARPIEDFAFYLSVAVFPLNFISSCLHGRSLLVNRKFITKMYFPRELVILSEVVANYISFLVIYAITIVISAFIRPVTDIVSIIMLPVLMLLLFAFGYGCSLAFSTISVIFTDFVYLINPVLSMLVWITPTFFLVSDVSGTLANIIWFNPLTYFVEAFHDILYYHSTVSFYLMGMATALTAISLVLGSIVFNRYKDKLPEVL